MAGIVSGVPTGIVTMAQFTVAWASGESTKVLDVSSLGATSMDELGVLDISPTEPTDGLNGGQMYLIYHPTSVTQITITRTSFGSATAPYVARNTYLTVARVRRS